MAAAYERYFLDSEVEEEWGFELEGVTPEVLGEVDVVSGLKVDFELSIEEGDVVVMDEEFNFVRDRVVTDSPPDLDEVEFRA